MSTAYPIEMGDLLLGMKQGAKADQTHMPYLSDVRIRMGPWYPAPWGPYTQYLTPLGSPETEVAEHGTSSLKYAVHMVMIENVIAINDPGNEGQIVGRSGANVGITEFVADTIAFYETNLLGLVDGTMLEAGEPPTCEAPADCYAVVQTEDPNIWLLSARLLYRARTVPFVRTG